jgi:hypothetical protein
MHVMRTIQAGIVLGAGYAAMAVVAGVALTLMACAAVLLVPFRTKQA